MLPHRQQLFFLLLLLSTSIARPLYGFRSTSLADNIGVPHPPVPHNASPKPQNAPSLLKLGVTCNNKECTALIDTGAQVTVMSLSTARRLGLEHLIDKNKRSRAAGVGGVGVIMGRIDGLPIQLPGGTEETELTISVAILDDSKGEGNIQLLLGLDALRKLNAVIDVNEQGKGEQRERAGERSERCKLFSVYECRYERRVTTGNGIKGDLRLEARWRGAAFELPNEARFE